jgi:hypothetical protein
MSWAANLWERLIGPVLDCAETRLADELSRAGYATRPCGRSIARVAPASDGEVLDAIALGGGSDAQELRRYRTGPCPDHCESLFHVRKDAA